MQKQLWFLAQLEPDTNPAYNVITAVRMSGRLDRLRLQRAFNAVVDRHESLRTGIALVEGEPQQVVLPSALVTVPMVDCSGRPDTARETMRGIVADELRTPFTLHEPPLLRVTLIRVSKDEHLLVITIHHVVCDGWSAELLFRDLATSYVQQSAGGAAELDELPIQYADYVVWQQEQLSEDRMRTELDYWFEQLSGMRTLDLPVDRPRPATRTVRGAVCRSTVSPDVVERLEGVVQRENASLFMLLLTAFAVLLARHSGERDVPIGSPVAGRRHPDTEQLIGFFANTVVLRCRLESDPTFAEALRAVRSVCLDSLSHEDVPLTRLVEELRPPRDLSRTPLFQVMFNLQNTPGLELQLPDLRLAVEELDVAAAKFELWLIAIPAESGMRLRLEYNTDLFEASTVDRLLQDYTGMLARLAEDPDSSAWELAGADEEQLAALRSDVLGAEDPVHVRGNPVVLSDVEAAIAERPGVAEAVVVASESRHEPELTGWLVRDGSDTSTPEGDLVRDVVAAIGRRLPQHAIPSAFGALNDLPRKPDGSIDRRALAALRTTHARHQVRDETPPRNPTEQTIADIFKEILKTDAVGVHASFFSVGGHSLLAAKIIARVRAEIGVLVPIRTFFRNPTIAGLAEAVAEIDEARRERTEDTGIHSALAGMSDQEINKLLDQLS